MLLIYDNIQITNQAVEKAAEDGAARTIQELVLRCLDAGCEAIDINSGPLLSHPEQTMTELDA